MTELDETLLALRALYARYKELEARYNAQTQCLVNVHRLLSPPLPQRMKKLNLIRCIEAARLEIDGCNAQVGDHGGAGDAVHEPDPLPVHKISRNRNITFRQGGRAR